MRAWDVPRAGAEVRLPDLPVPEVTEGTVLVKAQAAALNPVVYTANVTQGVGVVVTHAAAAGQQFIFRFLSQ